MKAKNKMLVTEHGAEYLDGETALSPLELSVPVGEVWTIQVNNRYRYMVTVLKKEKRT